jgi:phosphatidylglycerophosphatase A
MAIKESSDELNPAVVTTELVPKRPRVKRAGKDYFALAISTCGVGYMPIAPGTWGSLVGVGIYLLLQFAIARFVQPLFPPDSYLPLQFFIAAELFLITGVTLSGIWAGSRVEKLQGRKDPGKVVIDEVAGQLIALLPLIPGFNSGWTGILFAFLIFRLFDIVKPYPARRLEGLESGLGIMADDVVAGAYAAVATSIVISIRLLVMA